MTREDSGSFASPRTETLVEIEAYLAAPAPKLAFGAQLETQFSENRRKLLRSTFCNDAVGGLIASNLTGVALVSVGAMTAAEARDSFLAMHALSGAPILLVLASVQRFPLLLARLEALSKLLFLLAMAGIITVSRIFHGEIALYQAFVMSSLPVIFNLMQTIGFRNAAAMSGIYLPAMLWNAFTHPGFSGSASGFLACFYLLLTGVSLAANRRIEAAERVNFLNRLRETLRHAEVVEANKRLDALSRCDALTGLSNRRDFDERLGRIVEDARRAGRPLAVLMLDIDHFKLYNDALGHPEGDKCIRAIAAAVAGSIGAPPNFAGRVGGEEFAVVLPGAEVELAAAIAGRVRAGVEALRIPHPALGDRRIVSVSLGVACLNPDCPETPEALLGRADAALYRAKRAGRDRAEFDLRVVGA